MPKHTHNSPYYGNITIIADDHVWFDLLPETKELLSRVVNGDFSVSHDPGKAVLAHDDVPHGYVYDSNTSAANQVAYYKDLDISRKRITVLKTGKQRGAGVRLGMR